MLLYEAPLLRGLMGGVRSPGVLGREGAKGKLEVICGTRVRTGLFPKSEIEKLAQLQDSSDLVETEANGSDLSYDRITRSLMLDFALLCGTDFNRTVPASVPRQLSSCSRSTAASRPSYARSRRSSNRQRGFRSGNTRRNFDMHERCFCSHPELERRQGRYWVLQHRRRRRIPCRSRMHRRLSSGCCLQRTWLGCSQMQPH